MKVVAFVIGQLGFGGGEKQLYLLLRHIDREKYQPTVITFNPGGGDYWEEQIKGLNIPIVPIKRNPLSVVRILDLGKILFSLRPAIIVSWSLYLNFICSFFGRILGKPTVASIRCDLFNETTPKIKIHRLLGTKLATTYLVNSTSGKEDLINKLGINKRRVKVVYNAVDITEEQGYSESIRSQFAIPSNKFVIVNIGRLEPGKNQMMLLRVLKRLKVKGAEDVVVAFIGQGEEQRRLQSFANDAGLSKDVYFLGIMPKVFRYLKAFDVLCHCSLGEGMPNVIAEAAVMGVPVVSTVVNGLSDLVVQGETGYMVCQNDDLTMSEYVFSLYGDHDLRKKMSFNARRHILSDKFTPRKMADGFQELFG